MPDDFAVDRGGAGDAADRARVRLASLQVDAAQAYAAITAAEVALRVLAEHRVAAERIARHAAARHAAAARGADTCARARRGVVAGLAGGLQARAEWRAELALRQAALAEAERPLAEARRGLAVAREEFAAQVRAPAEAVTELRRLTAEGGAGRDERAACAEPAGRGRGGAARPREGPGEPAAAPGATPGGAVV